MLAGSNTFIGDMLKQAGLDTLPFADKRYPQVSIEDIRQKAPDVLLLSSEPYPFNKSHRSELHKVFPSIPIILVDGEMISWYGSRLTDGIPYLQGLMQSLQDNKSVTS